MPCEECENGKFKWGKTGSCKYDTIAECEEDNKDYYEDMKETKIVELIIQDDNQELAIDAISLVTSPAIEQDFVYFSKEKNNLTFAKVDEEKRMLISPALIPNKQIFRHNANTDSDYYVYFSKETVRKASELYLKHNNHHKATYQHQDRVSGVLTIESWIKEGDMDKSKMYGFDLPNGTWFVKMKIENDELWSKIKDGELRGLSIEGYFTDKIESMTKNKKMAKTRATDKEILSAFNELVSQGKIKDSISRKVHLKDVKTIEKLISQLDKQNDKLRKLAATTSAKFAPLKITDDAYAELDVQKEKIDAQQLKLGNKYEKQEESWRKARNAMNDANNYALTNDLSEAIKQVEAMAKQLGITKVPVVKAGQDALKREDKVQDLVDKTMELGPR